MQPCLVLIWRPSRMRCLTLFLRIVLWQMIEWFHGCCFSLISKYAGAFSLAARDPEDLLCLMGSASPGDCMGIGWPSEEEQARGAVIGWNMDEHINRDARCEPATSRTEGHIVCKVHSGCPVERTGVACRGEHPCMANIGPIRDRTVQVANKAH